MKLDQAGDADLTHGPGWCCDVQALEAAKARASAADELKELEAQLAQKEEECNAVQGDNYRMKREVRATRRHRRQTPCSPVDVVLTAVGAA